MAKKNNINSFLQAVYRELDFQTQNLSQVNGYFTFSSEEELLQKQNDFVEKGQWLHLSKYLNEKYEFEIQNIFFVENNPTIIFATTEIPSDRLHEIFNNIRNMARPRFLFLATDTLLEVFDLTDNPAKNNEELNPLETITNITEIAEKLQLFKREKIETGDVFGDEKFKTKNAHADKKLIEDLKVVRKELFKAGLNNGQLKYVHALIGRSIFIRYLEDRGIIKYNYFHKVAKHNEEWLKILNTKLNVVFYRDEMADLLYPRILSNHEFTYSFFHQLATDFNGDIFPAQADEEQTVQQNHLLKLRDFLLGNAGEQEGFFLWAYQFDIIPIELISNIYEEFYHFENKVDLNTKELKDSKGTHYTPAPLVEFVLNKALPLDVLKQKPRVLDPACGSGIFLVEAFRRMVRVELFEKQQDYLSFEDLLKILKNQIAGIELNEEAVKISAFSLYLAFLNYQEPPDIEKKLNKGKKLPMLICTDNKIKNKTYFDNLLHSNAFDEVDNLFTDKKIRKNFARKSFDIVVGNPPWGTPKTTDIEGREALKVIENWCSKNNKPISNKEPSQAFLWRAGSFLKKEGHSCLLVSSGVLLKSSEQANEFKQEWTNSYLLQEVVNLIHTRDVFFTSGISPFLLLKFKNTLPTYDCSIKYSTAKRTKYIENTQSIVFDFNDIKFFKYSDITNDIWKIYYFGNYNDFNLLNQIKRHSLLRRFMNLNSSGRGFEEGSKQNKASWLNNYRYLPTKYFNSKYNLLEYNFENTPKYVSARGKSEEIYTGLRLLFKAGITQKGIDKGQLIIRLENINFAYKHSIYCLKLQSENLIDYKVLLGVSWSSFTRYFFFMTASRWGVWHDDILLNEMFNLPINLEAEQSKKDIIVSVVDQLRDGNFIETSTKKRKTLFDSTPLNNLPTQQELEAQLDEAVFDLYMLTPAQRDLIKDRCRLDIDHFYHGTASIAVESVDFPKKQIGTLQTIEKKKAEKRTDLEQYVRLFLLAWDDFVDESEKIVWQFYLSENKKMLALVFSFIDKKTKIANHTVGNWKNVLSKLEKATQTKYSEKIYIEGLVVVVSSDNITIIKRNEKRLWTRSMARADAESTIVKAVNQQEGENE